VTDKPPTYASPEDALEAAENWTDKMLECRTYGHQWRPQAATYTKDRKAIATSQICRSCDAERHATLDARTGWVIATHIDYPDGYLLKGVGRITGDAKGALRLTTVTRVYGLRPLRSRKRAS
jgi:hypothetical protein